MVAHGRGSWALTFVVLPAVVLASASANAAVVLSDAFFRQDILLPLPEQHHFVEGSIGFDEEVITGGGTDLGHVIANAASWGGGAPLAAIDLDVTGAGNGAIEGQVYAGMTYYWAVEQVSGTPRSSARVLIQMRGAVSEAAAGDAGTAPYAEASVDTGTVTVFSAGYGAGGYVGDSFDESFTRLVTPETEYRFSLIAQGTALAGWEGGMGTARLDAWADPLIEIDPAWAYAADFRVVFSAGIGEAVPEPASWLLVGSVVALIAPAVRRRRRR